MPLGPKQSWNIPPQFSDPTQQDWATWLTNAVQDLQGPVTTPLAPAVATIAHPGAVQVVWNEQNQASAYSVYEMPTPNSPPGVPFITVAANMGAISNSAMRFNLNDTTTRYYSVVTITQYKRSAHSIPVAGAALIVGATVIPVSGTPINKNGVGGGLGGGGGIFGTGQGPLT